MKSKRESGEENNKKDQGSSSNLVPVKKPNFRNHTSSNPKSFPIILPACIIVLNVPESILDDGIINLGWLKDSLTSLNIPIKEVFGVSPGLDALSYGIIQFKDEDAGLMKALFLERCFQEKGKGLREWSFEDPRSKKGIYLWVAKEQDVLYVREFVGDFRISTVPQEFLEAARKDVYDNGANVCEVITQAMEIFECNQA